MFEINVHQRNLSLSKEALAFLGQYLDFTNLFLEERNHMTKSFTEGCHVL